MKRLGSFTLTKKILPYLPQRLKDILYHRLLLSGSFPEIVHIENTNACNAKCIMCPREKMNRNIGVMDFPLFKKVVDECAAHPRLKELHLHGYGECLLEDGFDRKVKYAKEKGIKTIYIVTNGSLLNEEICKNLISSGLDKMKISFYGATQEIYEKVHVNLKFSVLEKNVLNLLKLREGMGSKNPSVFLQFLQMHENAQERDIFFKKWEKVIRSECGDALLEFELHNYGGGRKYKSLPSETGFKKGCSLPFAVMQILWNGEVAACCLDFNGRVILGSVKNDSLFRIWNGNIFDRFRQAHRGLDFKEYPLCMQCDQIAASNQ